MLLIGKKIFYAAHPVHGCNCRNQFTLRFCVWLFPTADGKLFAWGRNSSGQLGLGKSNNVISLLYFLKATHGCTVIS